MHAVIDRDALAQDRIVERVLELYRAWRLTDPAAAKELAAELGAPDEALLESLAGRVIDRIERKTAQKEAHVREFFARIRRAI